MFTFGRDHEKRTALSRFKDPDQALQLLAVIDAVHDLIEGVGSQEALQQAAYVAFAEGRGGVWEGTEYWLRKAAREYPGLLALWPRFAADARWQVRFRCACVLDSLPGDLFRTLSPALAADANRKVANMAQARIDQARGESQP